MKNRILLAGLKDKNNGRVCGASLALVALLFGVVDVASASEGHISPADLIPYWVNFILYVGGLTLLLRGPVKRAWAERRTRIEGLVLAAARDLEVAEAAVKVEEQRGRTLDAHAEQAKADIRIQAEAETASIAKNAEDRSVRMRQQAEELLAGEGRAAEANYKAELLERALSLSRERFQTGDFASKDHVYRNSALGKAGRLVQ